MSEPGPTHDDVLQFLRELLQRSLSISPERVQLDATLASLELTSLDWVELQVELEMRYEVRVESGPLKNLRTVRDLLDHVAALRAA